MSTYKVTGTMTLTIQLAIEDYVDADSKDEARDIVLDDLSSMETIELLMKFESADEENDFSDFECELEQE